MLKSDPLFYLMKVGQYQSLTLAAENLHITQPALSIAIKNLEKELNLQLITRTRTGVILTKEAEKIVELAEKAFSYFNEIEEFVQQITLNKPIDISLYSTTPLNTLLIPALIKNYYQRYPERIFNYQRLLMPRPKKSCYNTRMPL